ncbi:hypothetical protein [Corynebacterium cystitidis]|uniref:hypothetical protein n=1 Tax=Corynebacterium cystitidis TaxID=35757 RepID=UPI00211DCCC1|nr:hypothetical protein [Corynebacterium cystitidis]
MTEVPNALPDDWFGLAGLTMIIISSVLFRSLFRDGEKKTIASEGNTEHLLDWFNARFTQLREEMADGFAERDARIDALVARDALWKAYGKWLGDQQFPRPPFLTFDEWIDTQKQDT